MEKEKFLQIKQINCLAFILLEKDLTAGRINRTVEFIAFCQAIM